MEATGANAKMKTRSNPKFFNFVFFLTTFIVSLGLVVSVDAAWYDSDWQYRKKLTLDETMVEDNLVNFPVLISFTGDTDLAADARSDFYDVLFTASDGTTKLDHEIESYNSTNGDIVAWVKVPTLSTEVDTKIFMYYGNAGANDQQNASGVWSDGYRAVWHLGESGNETGDYRGFM